jgi:predicted lipoprotein with Yx(FWY)xxD motif
VRTSPLIGIIGLAAIGLAACSSSGGGAKPASPQTTVASTAAPSASAAASVALADSPLGKIIVDAQGRTLYAFTKDASGTPTCTDACANAWPAALVQGMPSPGPGITTAITALPAPGTGTMLKAGKWPLYRFSGDAAPGDVNGEGSGGVWFVVGADGKLVRS